MVSTVVNLRKTEKSLPNGYSNRGGIQNRRIESVVQTEIFHRVEVGAHILAGVLFFDRLVWFEWLVDRFLAFLLQSGISQLSHGLIRIVGQFSQRFD